MVPAKLRRRFGIEEGGVVTAEEREDGILIRPAVVVPIDGLDANVLFSAAHRSDTGPS
jgi:bifunctional DNA-binding transcriptional regulator/antitoxin component of YhaV-PrlF toxin-antitoxin module